MTDIGQFHYYLSIEVNQKDNSIFISQSKYAKNLLKRFNVEDCNANLTPMETGCVLTTKEDSQGVNKTLYRQLVGSLIYLTITKPNI